MMDRRLMLGALAGAALFVGGPQAVIAQDKPELTFSAVFSQQDIRAEMMEMFKADVADIASLQLYYGGNLFKQGTEITAIQRGNLSMGNVAPQDIAKQIPAFSILTSAYLFRDAAHLKAFFESDAGAEMKAMAEDQLGIHILGPTYFGTRQVGLRVDNEIKTPADMQGIKLRMPGGEGWQFVGEALGANPTPLAFTEVYTALQTGAVDGQDNPLPADKQMKFYEVTDQIVMTSHNVGFGMLLISSMAWNELSPEQQAKLQAAADKATEWSDQQYLDQESELITFFEGEGLKVYTPDVKAFQEHAQKLYLESSLSESWPEGMLDAINKL